MAVASVNIGNTKFILYYASAPNICLMLSILFPPDGLWQHKIIIYSKVVMAVLFYRKSLREQHRHNTHLRNN